jgi:hypothetical protein
MQIDTIEDFVRVLDEHPEWRDALRSRLLSRELLEMPGQFARFIAVTREQFAAIDKQFATIHKRFAEIDKRFVVIDKRLAVVDKRLAVIDKRLAVIDKRFEVIDKRFEAIDKQFAAAAAERQSMRDDIGILKGAHARNVAERRVGLIARSLGLRDRRLLVGADLFDFARNAGAPMHSQEIQSYVEADLVFEAEDEGGGTQYVAIEVSYTANGRDTARAMRNAALITRFTERPCRPVVASLRIDDRIADAIEAGRVSWYPLPARLCRPLDHCSAP